MSHADRVRALLGQRRVIDDQHGLWPAEKVIGFGEEFALERGRVPQAIADEMMQLVIVGRGHAGGDRLDALALARPDQARDIEGAHAPARLVTQVVEEGGEPARQRRMPVRLCRAHDPLRSSPRGRRSRHTSIPFHSAKVVLGMMHAPARNVVGTY